MDDVSAQKRKENQSRFDDLCNTELVDKAASLAAAAMLAADQANAHREEITSEGHDNNTNIFILPTHENSPAKPKPISAPVQVAEAVDSVFFPNREERESFGNRVRRSPVYYAAPLPPPAITVIEHEHEDETKSVDHEEPVRKERKETSPATDKRERLSREQRERRYQFNTEPDVPEKVEETQPDHIISHKDIAELKEGVISQWDNDSIYEDEQQQTKVCYLIKIEELKEEGIPMYKPVDIESDLPAIKLCHAFMNERANRKTLLRRGKGIVKFGADLFGRATDFFQKNDSENDSTEWRNHFKETVQSGIHDIQIRRVVNKYENFHPPEELALLELMIESKSKFDDQRKKQRKLEHEEASKDHAEELDGLQNFLGNMNVQEGNNDTAPE